MAETLFGNEDLNAIAAEVVANPPEDMAAESAESASDDHEMAGPPPEGPSPVLLDAEEKPGGNAVSLALETGTETSASGEGPEGDSALRQSQAMRADMLKSLKRSAKTVAQTATLTENIELSDGLAQPAPKASSEPPPESIENQMDTVMTQTLAALDVSSMAPPVDLDEDDDKPKKKSGGLFARFRKSS